MIYVHETLIDNKIEELKHVRKKGKNAGTAKNLPLSRRYKKLKKDYYLPMRKKITSMDFSENKIEQFQECADILNGYYAELKKFYNENNLGAKNELKSTFLEEFSCYFFATIPEMQNYDVFNKGIFAGLKIKPDYTYEPITKDVDFCIGRKEKLTIGKYSEDIIIPAISIEFKTYTDATMLGEVMYTARKLKGANPRSKAYLLTWVNSFAADHISEAEFDSSLDEIVVLSPLKRRYVNGETITPVEFYAEGLMQYWNVISEALKVITSDVEVPEVGRLFAYADGLRSIKRGG